MSSPTPTPTPTAAITIPAPTSVPIQTPSSTLQPPSRPKSSNSNRSSDGTTTGGGRKRNRSRNKNPTAPGEPKSTPSASPSSASTSPNSELKPPQEGVQRSNSANRGKAGGGRGGGTLGAGGSRSASASSATTGTRTTTAPKTADTPSGAASGNPNPNSGRKRQPARKPSAPGPSKIQAIITPPQDALQAAASARKSKELDEAVGEAKGLGSLSNLQKIIGDIKSLGVSGAAASGKGGKDRRESKESSASPKDKDGKPTTSPIKIPEGDAKPATGSSMSGGSANSVQLKADAAPFTPSFAPAATALLPANLLSPAAFTDAVTARPGRTSFSQSPIQPNSISAAVRQAVGVSMADDPQSMANQHAIQAQILRQQYETAQMAQLRVLQEQEERRAMMEHQLAIQRLQAQAQQQQQVRNLPPRMMNRQQQQQPLYEEEPQSPQNLLLSPAFSFADIRRRSSGGEEQYNANGQIYDSGHLSGGGGAPMGINAGMLAGLAARAHQRNGSEMSPIMAEQLQIQQQIEMLQRQQQLLLQQQTQPSALSNLSAVLLSQQHQAQQQQQQQQQILQAELMRQAQVKAQQDAQLQLIQMQAQAQAQVQAQAEAQAQVDAQENRVPLIGHRRTQTTSALQKQPSLNDFVLPTFGGSGNKPSQPSATTASRVGDMGPPPVPTANHARRNSVQTHRPQNSIIGSFGGFVHDLPDEPIGGGGHNRTSSTASRGGLDTNWRMNAGSNNASNNNGNMLLDLNQAQQQLQLLAQFRATQVGGTGQHSKMASFSFPNMLPNLMMASTMGAAPQSIVQQQQAFQMQLQQNGNGPQRKSLFAPYLPQGSLPPLLSAGKLVVGVLRVNKRNRSDAYVATDVLEADIYICGSKDRNRALEGDIVAVELLDVDEVWGSKKEKEEKKRKKEENSSYDLGAAKSSRKNEKKKDDVEVEGQGMVLFDDEEVTDEQKPTYAGHVVAVVERMTGQLFSGQLGVLRPSSAATKEKQDAERRDREGDDNDRSGRDQQRPKIVWFKPTDKRVPLIAIPTEQAPADFVENQEAYADRLFVALIKRWPITSLHPFGTLVEQLGTIGEIEVETSALLKDCNFSTEDFTDPILKCLPPVPWAIPDRELETRRDMRTRRVFTIDPETAKDLDDALSVTQLEDGTYEVGVHIADVSHFVRPNTPLDRDARKRATSVYLVQRAVPMLPPLLCEELCSLVPGVDRLAFSAFFVMDAEGNVSRKYFQKTIIKSCGKLSYGDAQSVIDGEKLSREIDATFTASDVAEDIKTLNTLAKKMRARRFASGALKIDNVKLWFALDDEGRPTDCTTHAGQDANALVEEFMLLANMSAASFIANGLPEQALLRRHEAPVQRRIDGFVTRAKRLGFEFEGTTSTEIQAAFNKVDDKSGKLVLQILATRAMMRAKYFCAGMLDIAKYSHFALNVPLYTHFTSPIRRYADVMVHRMIEACLTESPESKFLMDRDQVAKCAQHCNAKKDAAKAAQEQSAHLHLCFLIHDLTQKYGPVVRDAKVVGVLDSAFDVVVPEFGIEKRVHADKMPINNHVFDEHKDLLSLYWSEQDVIDFLVSGNDDPHLELLKSLREKALTTKGEGLSEADLKSKQRVLSAKRLSPEFKGLRQESGHKIQDIRELDTIPVIVSADLKKSPPVLIVHAVNPYAK